MENEDERKTYGEKKMSSIENLNEIIDRYEAREWFSKTLDAPEPYLDLETRNETIPYHFRSPNHLNHQKQKLFYLYYEKSAIRSGKNDENESGFSFSL